WVLFFLAGMAFMATLIFMVRPEIFSHETVRERPGSSIILGGNAQPLTQEDDSQLIEASHESTFPKLSRPTRAFLKQPNEDSSKSESTARSSSENATNQTASFSEPSAQERVTSGASSLLIPTTYVSPGRRVLGHVKLMGELPPPKTLRVADNYCGSGTTATSLVSRAYIRAPDDSLADVLVFINDNEVERAGWSAPKQTVVIANRNCQFEPYVTAIQAGQTVDFENLDPVLHNVRIIQTTSNPPREIENPAVNVALLPNGKPFSERFKAPDFFLRVDCNVHPYMVAYICVMPHPFFAVTKADGRFEIQNIKGDFTVSAYHRKAGWLDRRVKITDNESPVVEFVFEVPTDVAQKE
ncbi:MAG: hypothetical protein ACXWIU_06275, partial [Limisphaerales bacterium]